MLANVLLWVLVSCIVLNAKSRLYRSDAYPTSVPKFDVRLDVDTNKSVVSGLMHTLPAHSTLSEFRHHLQCAVKEPNLNYNNGMISRMRLHPPTSHDYKVFCSYVEKRCNDNWAACISQISRIEKGDFNHKSGFNGLNGWSNAELLRVINGTLHYDWPWGIERLNKTCPNNPLSSLINATLSRISDMRDSAFFTGGADPALPMEVEIPYFSHCTHENFADMVVPWFNMFLVALSDYRKARQKKSNFTEANYQQLEPGYRSWQKKIPKAALFTSSMQHRMFLYDQARLYPQYIDSVNALELGRFCFTAWNPGSTEECTKDSKSRKWPTAEELLEYESLPPGYSNGMFNVTSPHFTTYYPASYKYVVIPLGRQTLLSTSARIFQIMFYSGAVAIMPRTSWIFHVQAQLKPWVHYVPISFTGADLAEKVQWLNEHDNLAQQIAENGRNFARSYLRLEDFYCYTANWLDLMAEINSMTNAASRTYSPLVYPKLCDKQHPGDFEFPV